MQLIPFSTCREFQGLRRDEEKLFSTLPSPYTPPGDLIAPAMEFNGLPVTQEC